jgi:hypothetical protein
MADTFSVPCDDAAVATIKPNANAAMETIRDDTVQSPWEVIKTLAASYGNVGGRR